MDGTITDLYGVKGWLEMILKSEAKPYEIAKPLVNMARLAKALNKLQRKGIGIGVVSWLAKDSNKAYDEKVIIAKKKWLTKHLPSVKWNEIKIVPYGTPKHEIAKGILFDDEAPNREKWGEGAYEPKKIFEILASA